MTNRDRNQGEGNVDAARNYNEATQEFVESGKVEEHEADRREIDKRTRDALERAEEEGKARIAETDPEVSEKTQRRTS